VGEQRIERQAFAGQIVIQCFLNQGAAVHIRAGLDFSGTEPDRTHNAAIQRARRIMGHHTAHKRKAQVGHIGIGGFIGIAAHVSPSPAHRLHMMGGFLQGFAGGGLRQGFPRIQVPGGLIQTQAIAGLLLHHEELAAPLHQCCDGDIRFPIVHAASLKNSRRPGRPNPILSPNRDITRNRFPPKDKTMQIGVPKETLPGERRVAATAETVKKLVAAGHQVLVAEGAGTDAGQTDAAYSAAGAQIGSQAQALAAAMVFKVRSPQPDELAQMQRGAVLIGMLSPFDAEGLQRLNAAGLTAFALEAAPRTSRAQSMDVLSSQANIAGYKAVMLAAATYPRFFPMLMTAAGTVKAARVVILGAGVAGLQAIATAKRLGAVIEASDVRPAVKEQIESLGAKFIDVPFETDEEREIAKGVGGYARPMPASWMQRQSALVAKRIEQADVVITTALIPGRKAPVLVTEDMVKSMKPGSVIIDMAVEQGGNCPLSEAGKVVVKHGVILVGETNLPATVPADASALYARNLIDFLKLVINKESQFFIDLEDDIVKACLMCRDGTLLRT
jgi:H+-translocating NAD(P) transhydrogenase subunit alpha